MKICLYNGYKVYSRYENRFLEMVLTLTCSINDYYCIRDINYLGLFVSFHCFNIVWSSLSLSFILFLSYFLADLGNKLGGIFILYF